MPRKRSVWVFQRKDRPGWWVGWYHADKLRKEKFPTKTKAERRARELEGQMNAGLYFEPEDICWPELVSEYMTNRLAPRRKRTQTENRLVFTRFSGICQPKKLLGITMSTVEDYVRHRRETDKVSGATVNKDLRILRAIFNYAVKKKWLKENPAAFVDFALVEHKLPRLMDPGNLKKLLMAVEKTYDEKQSLWWRVVLGLLATTGMRPGELVLIKLGDVEVATGRAKVHGQKTHRERVVEIFLDEKNLFPHDVLRLLVRYLNEMPEGQDLLFPLNRTAPTIETAASAVAILDKHFRRVRDAAGLSSDVFLYDLRRSFCTWMAGHGFKPYEMKAQVGNTVAV
ncbi:MAG: site-specific integrase, partial [Phycisphaerae bacterium]|nr:site-specific integrase [Phycisphaerae bacterium]